jgi:hypothetical protein
MAPELVEQLVVSEEDGRIKIKKEEPISDKERKKREIKKYKQWKSMHFDGDESDEKSLTPNDSP